MKKVIILTLLLVFGIASVGYSATDWSKFENKGNALALEGYQGQPGYIRFYDGSGTLTGYFWISKTKGPMWCTPGAIDLTTTKLTDYYGFKVSDTWSAALP